jgi:hypothetical protein
VSAPHALFVPAPSAPRRAILPAMAACDQAMAPRAQAHPAFPWWAAWPGAGAVLAPRLRVACGAHRARSAAAEARQKDAGIAPVTERRGKNPGVPWRWQGPTGWRHTVGAGAAASMRPACGARAYAQQPPAKGASQPAAGRARAFPGSRRLLRGWQQLHAVYCIDLSQRPATPRGSPLLHTLAKVS